MPASPFTTFLGSLRAALAAGDATEHTHRSALETLLESFGEPTSPLVATNEPRRILCGAPDFLITRAGVPVGHVETKDIGTDLDRIVRGRAGTESEQFKRYLGGLPNWVLTDYLEFRWYVAGNPEPRRVARLASLDANGRTLRPEAGGDDAVRALLEAFFLQRASTVTTAAELAARLAGMSRLLRVITLETLRREDPAHGFLQTWLRGFREVLVPGLLEDDFADMFAQTLAYGLFAARLYSRPGERFTRQLAPYELPRTNPFLRSFFAQIAGADLPDTLAWYVDTIAALLDATNPQTVLADFGEGTERRDPVLHFYEDFLRAYDPAQREARGVYYTPEPVVGYLVRSVDRLLRQSLGRSEGLADRRTLILDPATGTATFPHAVIAHLHEQFVQAGQKGMWPGYVKDHLLTRLFGFELLMAPYTVAHLKLGLQLRHTGYEFGEHQRLGIYLTNTLDEAVHHSDQLVAGFISAEADAAADLKTRQPILVVLGNPPYFGRSANPSTKEMTVKKGQTYDADYRLEQGKPVAVRRTARGDGKVEVPNFIGGLLQDYYVCDGAWLAERNTKWLQNDYVKFIRFAQWRVERTGEGIVAFITDNSYLASPTFRGMRQSLRQAFHELYIFDLHGNSRKKETVPGGGLDENVFDIQQGVCLLLAVRTDQPLTGPARVHHADLYGERQDKYDRLNAEDVGTTAWRELQPAAPNYLLVPRNETLEDEYKRGWKISEVFAVNNVGIVTARDSLTICFSREEAWQKIVTFAGLPTEEARTRYDLGADVQDWKVVLAQGDLNHPTPNESRLTEVVYRPFDLRWTYYTGNSRGFHCRPRNDTMRHLVNHQNLALIATRQTQSGQDAWGTLVTRQPIGHKAMAAFDINSLFPLYVYPDTPRDGELAIDDSTERRPNLAPAFLRALGAALDLPVSGLYGLPEGVTPEDVFQYAYAVFHTPAWIARFAEFLRADFPRLPLPPNRATFRALAAAGAELSALDLLESPLLDAPGGVTFPVAGTAEVDGAKFSFPTAAPGSGRVWINTSQYFEGVSAATWETRIGGYQPAKRWLDDRKGRQLSYDDIRHYQRVLNALTLRRAKTTALDALAAPLLAPDTPTERDQGDFQRMADKFMSGEWSVDLPDPAESTSSRR